MANAGEMEMPSIRHSSSFDSNPESRPEETTWDDYLLVDASANTNNAEMSNNRPESVQYPASSGIWKRQSYRNVAINSRHRRLQVATSPGATTNQPQSSFDSIDTIETSSTDASRLDQVTTSFESSATDATESTNGQDGAGQQSQQQMASSHKMLSLRGDSGYKSLDSAAAPSSALRSGKSLATTLSEGELFT